MTIDILNRNTLSKEKFAWFALVKKNSHLYAVHEATRSSLFTHIYAFKYYTSGTGSTYYKYVNLDDFLKMM